MPWFAEDKTQGYFCRKSGMPLSRLKMRLHRCKAKGCYGVIPSSQIVQEDNAITKLFKGGRLMWTPVLVPRRFIASRQAHHKIVKVGLAHHPTSTI